MSKLKKERRVALEFGEDVTIKKWSTAKLLHIVSLLSGLGKEALDGIYDDQTKQWDYLALAQNILGAMGENTTLVIEFVNVSVPGSSVEDVQELDPEDLLTVITEILDQNLTEGLGKKLSGLLGTFLKKSAKVTSEARGTEEPVSETGSSK